MAREKRRSVRSRSGPFRASSNEVGAVYVVCCAAVAYLSTKQSKCLMGLARSPSSLQYAVQPHSIDQSKL
jgi:hypothetical protein